MDDVIILNVDDVVIYDNDIEMAIAEACAKFNIEDLKKEGQRPWKAVLQHVGKRVFPDTKILKNKSLNIYINNNIPTNCNSYDYELLNNICDYYILLSDKYNKLISIIAFSHMCNIHPDVIDKWANDEPSSTSYHIWKKLRHNREDCLKDKNFDSNNVVGAISIGNTEYGWNMPGVSRESANSKHILTASELPKLSQNTAQLTVNED